MYTLNIIADTGSTAPPDFILYVMATHTEVPFQIMGKKFDYKKQGDIHILRGFGIKSQIRIIDIAKPNKNHYALKLFIKAKLPIISEAGLGSYDFINVGTGKTKCSGGGIEIYQGVSEFFVRICRNKIEQHFLKMFEEYIEGITKLWDELDIAKQYLSDKDVMMIQEKRSFDELLDFGMCVDYLSVFSKNINELDDSIKAVIQECFSLLSGNPRSCVIAAGVFTEDIVKQLCPKNWDPKAQRPKNWHPKKLDPKYAWANKPDNYIRYLEVYGIIPEEIKNLMNSVRIFRNTVIHDSTVNVTIPMAMSILLATLAIAKWYTEQIELKNTPI